MSIAAINSMVLALTLEKSQLEAQRMILDQRRQTLTLHSGEIQSDYQAKLSAKAIALGELDPKDEDDKVIIDSIDQDWEIFKAEYNVQSALIESQDKVMEMERANLQTKLEAITTSLESQEKRLSKNVESEMKTFS